MLAAWDEAGGQEDVNMLIRVARNGEDLPYLLEYTCPITSLLGQLPSGTLDGALPSIEGSRGNLPEKFPHRVPILVDHHHPLIPEEGHDGSGPRMANDF